MTASRVLERLDELYAIGGGPGANRVGGSVGEDRAHEFAAAWMEEAGLTVEVDSAGNLVGRTSDPAVMTGSHLDSVPQGGKFDGALGVVAGIEAVERVGRGAVVVFRDEERGCVGSSAFVAAGARPSAFLEVHVEQGPVLEQAGAPLEVEPGFGNVIPGRVRVAVDARAPDRERLNQLAAELELEPTFRLEPVAMAAEPRAALRVELEERGLPVVELPSGAGHDAAILATAGIPTAMLFVRSLNGGVSHSPEEESSPEDVLLAVDVLAGALARLTARSD